MINSFIFRNIAFVLILVFLLSGSCSEAGSESRSSGVAAKVLKVNTNSTIPKCCSNKPPRFPVGQKMEKLLK